MPEKLELLKSHKIFGKCQTRDLWLYVEEYCQVKNQLWEHEGVRYGVSLNKTHLRKLIPVEAIEPDWTIDNLVHSCYLTRIIVTPGGQIFVKDDSKVFFITVIRNPVDGSAMFRYLHEESIAYRLVVKHENIPKEWLESYNKLNKLENLRVYSKNPFRKMWVAARNAWIKEQKESGEWQRVQEYNAGKRLGAKTDKKMAVCLQTKDLINTLEEYLKSISDGTTTQRQVGNVYDEMMKLASLNKRFKHFLIKPEKRKRKK